MHVRTIKGIKYLYKGNKYVRKPNLFDKFMMNNTFLDVFVFYLWVFIAVTTVSYLTGIIVLTMWLPMLIFAFLMLSVIKIKAGDYYEKKE